VLSFVAREQTGLLRSAVLALVGFGVVSLGLSTASARRADAPRRTQLIDLIGARKTEVANLDAAVRDLRGKIDQAQSAAGQLNATEREQASIVDRLSLQAATTAVAGPGLVVRLSDSTRRPSDLAQASAYRIHDIDLQLVVNALFDAGAEAVAVNGNRLAVTTPIRGAGQTIVVNFRPLTPPYVVQAIGADRGRFDASDTARRFHRWTSLFGLGFSIHQSGKMTLPAYTGRVGITTADPTILLGPLGATP
jgi:uncharacterized protein YlxW (UPF0749 family)